jgi:hypothetical protein
MPVCVAAAGGIPDSYDVPHKLSLYSILSLQEEISHCAAGVRWLRHLHKVATTSQPPSDPTAAAAGAGAAEAAAAAAAAAGGQAEANGSTEQQQQQQVQQSNGSSMPAAAAAADWAADARKYETVEEWFHSLIRSHFKGTLKV